MVYPFQTAPLTKLNKGFLNDVDKIIRSASKEVLELPGDIPNAMLYAPKTKKGLGMFRASWEAPLQHINCCKIISEVNNPYIKLFRDFQREIKYCFKRLELNENGIDIENPNTKKLRETLQESEFHKWCALRQKGRGVILFQEYPPANLNLNKMKGLNCSEYKEYLKMVGDVAPVRATHGRSKDGNRCRHCPTTETYISESMPHVLGVCPFGELLRNKRHHTIRSILARALKEKGYEVHEEVTGTAENGSIRRIDIIAIDKNSRSAFIIDPTIRYESEQPAKVDKEKKDIYIPTVNYFKEKYDCNKIEVIGLFIGSRGTISKIFCEFANKFKLKKKTLLEISTTTVKLSISILRNHLYSR